MKFGRKEMIKKRGIIVIYSSISQLTQFNVKTLF